MGPSLASGNGDGQEHASLFSLPSRQFSVGTYKAPQKSGESGSLSPLTAANLMMHPRQSFPSFTLHSSIYIPVP